MDFIAEFTSAALSLPLKYFLIINIPPPSSLARHPRYNHYWIQVVCRVPEALGKAEKTLGNRYAECSTRRTTLAKNRAGEASTAHASCLLPPS
jgi:hypothetical protein